jgi:hypothetical protein
MRGARQRKFERAISRISWRVSRAIPGAPTAPAQDHFGSKTFSVLRRHHHDLNT